MSMSGPEQALLICDHRRRRWIIRLCLAFLFTILILTVIGLLLMSPMGMTAEEAEEICEQFDPSKVYHRTDFERLLGKPHQEKIADGRPVLNWRSYSHSLIEVKIFGFELHCFPDGVTYHWLTERGNTVNWQAAWRLRWMLFKNRLGWK